MGMRVSTNMFTQQFQYQINQSLTNQYDEQNKIASGLAFSEPSDNPIGFDLLKQHQTIQNQTTGYLNATAEALNEATYNASAMSDLQTLMSRASELATSGLSSALGSEGLEADGVEINTLITQVQAIANRSDNGYYAFGGTQNKAPVSSTSPPGYNTAVLTDNTLKKIQIAANSNPVNVQIFAGSLTYAAGATAPETSATFATTAVVPNTGSATGTPMEGFLVKAGATGAAAGTDPAAGGGVDILGFLRNAAATLSSGKPLSSDQLDNVIRAANYTSQYVGQTTATEAQFSLNQQALTSFQNSTQIDISSLSSANIASLSTDLSSSQTSYQGALAAGAKILQMSLLNYLH